eukprot:90973-Rhodomonas_salina.1
MVISILAVNDAPSFVVRDIQVNSALQSVAFPFVASEIRSGPQNENDQALTFVVTDMTNPRVFATEPVLTLEGTLLVDITPFASGICFVSLVLQDSGGTAAAGSDTSEVRRLKVTVGMDNIIPSVELPWVVNCVDAEDGACSCLQAESNAVCAPVLDRGSANVSSPSVSVLEDCGSQEITHFAAQFSTAMGFAQASMSTFTLEPVLDDANAFELAFSGLMQDPRLLMPGLEYMVDYVASSDGLHLYATDITNSVQAFAYDDSNAENPLTWLDRRAEGEDRLRFLGFPPDDAYLSQGRPLDTDAACGWEMFEASGSTYAVLATGCDLLENNELLRPEGECPEAMLSEHCDINCCERLLQDTVGLWRFEAKATQAIETVNAFTGAQTVSCSQTGCRYQRPLVGGGCFEQFPTVIEPAAFGDQVNLLGAAFLIGPNCKIDRFVDWDNELGNESLSAKTF